MWKATLSTVTIIFTKNTCSAFYSRKQLGERKRWGEKNKQISCFVPSPLFCFFTRNISYLSLWCHFQQHHRTRLFVIYWMKSKCNILILLHTVHIVCSANQKFQFLANNNNLSYFCGNVRKKNNFDGRFVTKVSAF